MSESRKGKGNVNYGKPMSEAQKQQISKTKKGNCGGPKHPNWQGGISYFPYCIKFDNSRREATRIFFNRICIVCGKLESENMKGKKPVKLSVHHVDHDKEQGCNGKPFNLFTLCHVCHGREQMDREGYKKYINHTFSEGIKWGIWSLKEFEETVMYPDKEVKP
jgi:hypothetical protein